MGGNAMNDAPMTRSENMTGFLKDLDQDPKREPFATILWHLKESERELADAQELAGPISLDLISKLKAERDEARAQLREEQHLHTVTLNERDRLADALKGLIDNYQKNKGQGLGLGPIVKANKALAAVKGDKP
jgi:hypothetical protein